MKRANSSFLPSAIVPIARCFAVVVLLILLVVLGPAHLVVGQEIVLPGHLAATALSSSSTVCQESLLKNGECDATSVVVSNAAGAAAATITSTADLNASNENDEGSSFVSPTTTTTEEENVAPVENEKDVTDGDSDGAREDNMQAYEPYRCNIYMAPSSIPGAGFGIYTVRDIAKGEKVLPYADAPSIPVCDGYANGLEETDWNHVDYLWSGKGLAEYECKSVSESVVTFGALCNFHTYLANVHPVNEIYDDTVSNRYTSPFAGSFSYHGGHSFEATADIPAGGEIFADYGEKWLDNRAGTFADVVPREDDFRKAATLFNKIYRETFENKVHVTDPIVKTFKSIASTLDPRVGSILPDTSDKFKYLAKEQYRSRNRSLKTLLAENTIEHRSIDWIKENGICLDLIRPGKSTIPDAGKGAFAQGYITKDTIISPGPLLNIKDRNLLKMYNSDDEVVGEQLLLNYCFGHVQSPLLLCPQTNMILMNHCSSRKPGAGHCGDRGPNAKVRWGTSWDPDTPEWLTLSLEEVIDRTANQRRGLSLEVIALRDIHPGEEVLIDYGENWENAFEHHVKNWEPPVDDGTYIPVRTMIENKDFRTVEELEENPYPENVMNVCYFYNDDDDDEDEDEDEENKKEYYEEEEDEEEDDDYVLEIEKSGSSYVAKEGMDILDYYIYECEIMEEYEVENKTQYTVRVLYSETKHFILTDYPVESVSFRMRKYQSDQFRAGVFRHFIEIDDDIFPKQWKVHLGGLEQ